MTPQVHWEQGQFLQPHHFQRMQRALLQQFSEVRRLTWPYAHGVIRLKVAESDLALGFVRLLRLHAIIGQSGTEVNYGDEDPARDNAALTPLNINPALKHGSGDLVVCLGLPRWSDRSPNIASSEQKRQAENRIYWTRTESQADENTGTHERTLRVRVFNARLVLAAEAERDGDLELLPLLRVLRPTGNSPARFDPQFVPASLVLQSSPVIHELAQDLVHRAEEVRRALVFELTREGPLNWENLRGIELERMLRLRSLNGFSNRAAPLVGAGTTTTLTMFQELSFLLGELAALQPHNDSDLACPAFDHEDPFTCFAELSKKLLLALHGPLPPLFLKVDFHEPPGAPKGRVKVLQADLTDEHFAAAHDYYLGVRAHGHPEDFARSVTDGSLLNLRSPSKVLVPGAAIPLREERQLPDALPREENLNYFYLLRRDEIGKGVWQQVQSERALALWLGPEFQWRDAEFSLYMPLRPAAPKGD
jgi:type VI secretion system protein ImpJ